MRKLTHARLVELLDYDERTGVFRWRQDVGGNGCIKAGMIAGTVVRSGSRIIQIEGQHYAASRLAVFYVRGEWPGTYVPSDPQRAVAGERIVQPTKRSAAIERRSTRTKRDEIGVRKSRAHAVTGFVTEAVEPWDANGGVERRAATAAPPPKYHGGLDGADVRSA